MTLHQKGFVYILSNKEYAGKYKIGKTKDNPVIRAKTLTKQTGAIGEFEVEWSMEVPDITIAESVLHYKFREYHYSKEYFEFDLDKTKENARKILENFFIDEYNEEKLKVAKTKALEMKKELMKL